jgi:hypothetical protein
MGVNALMPEDLEKRIRNIEGIVQSLDVRMSFLVGNDGKRGILLPECEKKSIKRTIKLHRWVIYIYGTIIIAMLSGFFFRFGAGG